MAQADNVHTTPRREDDLIEQRLVQERINRRDCKRDEKHFREDAFRALYAEWLRLLAEEMDPAADDETDEVFHARARRIDELGRTICATPAPAAYQVLDKVRVLEYALAHAGGAAWVDNREVAMLGGIKADLLRLEPGIGA